MRRRRGERRDAWQERLALAYRSDPAAREAALVGLLPLAQGLARKFKRGEEPLEDLEQVAAMALVKALQRYDGARTGHFARYAIPTITGELRRHYRDKGWAARVPRGMQERALRLTAAERQWSAAHGQAPTTSDLASVLGLSAEEISEGRVAYRAMRASSLDGSAEHELGRPRAEHGEIDAGFERAEQRADLDVMLGALDERDRSILWMWFEDELTQREIGAQVGFSQMHVSRKIRQMLEGMRSAPGSEPSTVLDASEN